MMKWANISWKICNCYDIKVNMRTLDIFMDWLKVIRSKNDMDNEKLDADWMKAIKW